jgi:hypothetical protein
MLDDSQTPDELDDEQSRVYRSAYNRGKHCDAHLLAEQADGYDDLLTEIATGFDHFTESARWCHNLLPELQAIAGYEYSGHGTFTQQPDEEAGYRLEELVDAYRRGYTDGCLDAVEQVRPAILE